MKEELDNNGNLIEIEENSSKFYSVEIEYFIYLIFNNNIRLKWKTSSERNNYGFEIEKDLSGKWVKIGFIPSYTGQIYEYTDYNLKPGIYKYRLKQIEHDGKYKYSNLENEILINLPRKYSMSQNFPNPFNKVTKITIELPYEEYITMKVFDTNGREVADIFSGFMSSGTHELQFNNKNLQPDIYYYKLIAGSFADMKIMEVSR
ncbi:MAG: T9SS type A sorting domain-containing protein [Ignavibacteria bacterium]|nr:T9SS type A sorting domain-containing protein [Ignavibacteria bacterium]